MDANPGQNLMKRGDDASISGSSEGGGIASSSGPVNQEEFDQVWRIVAEIGASERHFNQIESSYRAYASTWLLAVFVGIGFVLSQNAFVLPIDRLLVAAALCLIAVCGVTMLWYIDLLVYHQLLDAYFEQGLRLEKKYSWLPPVRTQMMQAMNGRGVILRVVWFYTTADLILVLLAGTMFSIWLKGYGVFVIIGGVMVTAAVMVLVAVILSRCSRPALKLNP